MKHQTNILLKNQRPVARLLSTVREVRARKAELKSRLIDLYRRMDVLQEKIRIVKSQP